MVNRRQKKILEIGGKKLARNEHHIIKCAESGSLRGHRLWNAITRLTGKDSYNFDLTADACEDLKAELERQELLEANRLRCRHPLADKNRLIVLHQAINSLTHKLQSL